MLAYFPTPYPDELLLSVLGRLADTMQYPYEGDLSTAIYGQLVLKIAADLPNRLDDLVAALPPGHALTVDQLIDEHTLFPFYQPFLPAERAERLRALMRGKGGGSVYWCAGILSHLRPVPKFLRFCSQCVPEDRQQYGQCYWHRLHQVPGVHVCPRHGAPLQDSPVPMYHRAPGQRYISAERALAKVEPSPDNLSPVTEPVLLQLARDAAWLLQQRQPHLTPTTLSARFHHVLAGQGLATYTGKVRVSDFMAAFERYYAPELLHFLDCAINYDDGSAWPLRLIKTSGRVALLPLHCLLVIYFLGYTAESFFALPSHVSYFGAGPWPCLNPICEHYHRAVIERCHVDYVNIRLQATFVCSECGFIYRRLHPDTSEADQFRYDQLLSRGPVWESRLRQMWRDPSLKPNEVAAHFKISRPTAETYLRRSQPRFQAEYRKLWLAALRRQPQAQLAELVGDPVLDYLYRWLLENDREWYLAHQPQGQGVPDKPQPRHTVRSKVTSPERDGANRDGQLAEEIRLAARHLRQQPGRPMLVTQAAIWRHLGQSRISYGPDRFPLTWRVLTTVVESRPAFAIRSLEWATKAYQAEHIWLPKWILIKRAGVGHLFHHPQGREFIENILAHLNEPELKPGPSLVHLLLPSARPDWPAVDAQLAERVSVSARQLKARPGYPIRVTTVTIGTDLDELEVMLLHLDMLPQTAAVLAKVVETEEAFVTRVLEWIRACDPQVCACRHRSQFVRLAGLWFYAKIPAISQLIDEVFTHLKAQAAQDRPQSGIDWAARDEKVARMVKEVAAQLKHQTEPFVRVSRTAIGRAIDDRGQLEVSMLTLFPLYQFKLPQTARLFKIVQESWEQFRLRCLAQVAEKFRQQGIRPIQSQLLKAAGIRLYLAEVSPVLQQALSETMDSLVSLPSAYELSLQARWAALDAELSALIEPAARELKAQTDPFVRVNKSTLGRYLAQYHALKENLDKLPRTAEAVARAVETREEFAIRRLRWLGADYQQRQERPSARSRLIRQAGVLYVSKRPGVQAVIAEVLAMLSSFPVEPRQTSGL
jgi:hypothetical protein